MCVVSMIGDYYKDKWLRPYGENPQFPPPYNPGVPQVTTFDKIMAGNITRKEFDDLKKEVSEMKELLVRAKIYDEKNNEPDCEIEEKMDLLRKVAAAVGIDLDDVIKKKANE